MKLVLLLLFLLWGCSERKFSLLASESVPVITFEKWKGQAYTEDKAKEDFASIANGAFIIEHPENLSVDDEGNLTFRMLKGKIWTEGSGAQVKIPIKKVRELTLTYEVLFDGGEGEYDWTAGGKLPGVAGGKGYTGGDPANNGDGFSARLMFGYDRAVWAYIYHKDMGGKYGEALNNGSEIGETSSIRYATDGSLIDYFLLVSFHGGATDDYRPSHEQYVKFRGFSFRQGASGTIR